MHLPPAPRRVPLSLSIATIFGRGAQIGWFVFGFTSIFFWGFVSNAESPFAFRGPLAMAGGRITEVKSARASENHHAIMENHYEYSVAGQRYEGVSYSLGLNASAGDTVVVQYRADDPRTSRVEGMRSRKFGSWLLLIAILPLAGVGAMLITMRTGLRRRRLLVDGVTAEGTLVNWEATNTRVNNRRLYELTYQFTPYDGVPREAKSRTTETDNLERGRIEPLLYLPVDPSLSCLVSDLPLRLDVDEVGQLKARPVAALLLLIIPAIVTLGNLLAARS